jgi:hypothetical protein
MPSDKACLSVVVPNHCALFNGIMEEQVHKPHRKAKVKAKKHIGGKYQLGKLP